MNERVDLSFLHALAIDLEDEHRLLSSERLYQAIAELRRLRGLEADALRYAWLRAQPNDTETPRIDVVQWGGLDESASEGEGIRLEALDAAIDAALVRTPIGGTLTAADAASPEQGATLRGPQAWRSGEERPADGEHVAYLFAPFGTYHFGVYDAASDSVHGKSGFTTWQPEVTAWFPLPKAHNGAVTPPTALYRANLIDPAAPHKDAPSEFFNEVDDDYARSLTRRRSNKVSVPPAELQVHQHVETLTGSEQTPAAGKPEDA